MKLAEIFRYELQHRLRSASTWVYTLLLFLVAVWIFLATADGAAVANAPVRVAQGGLIVGTFGLLISAALFGDAAVRDVGARMDPLLFTAPLRKAEYLVGRFLGALATNALVLVAIPLGMLAAIALLGQLDPESIGPLRAVAFLQPFVLLSLPNLVVVGALLFTLAMLARNVVPAYLAAIGLFIGYVAAMNYWGQITSPLLAILADPFGIGALEHLTRYWTKVEQSARLVGFPPALLWNRAVWLVVALALFALLHGRSRFAHATAGGRRRKRPAAVAPSAERDQPVAIPRVAATFGPRTRLRQVLEVAAHSLAEVAASRWFAVVLLACLGLTMLWRWNVGDTVFDTSTWPVTLLVVEEVLSQRIVPLVYVLIAVYAGELVWKDREVAVAEIEDCAPVPDGASFAGRLLALVAIIVLFQALAMAGGLLIQALQGYTRFELDLYLTVAFGMNLIEYVALAVLALTIHVLVNHKYVGHLLVVIAFAAPVVLRALGLVEHNLLLYGGDPSWTYSDMNGFGPFAAPFLWFKLYWSAWALLLAVVAALFWVRGREPGLRSRLRQARARLTDGIARTTAASLALILGLGSWIFYNTNVRNEYRARADLGATQAAYEQRYGQYAGLAQPTITHAELHVEIFPAERAVEIRGGYRLVNRTDRPIAALHVSLTPEVAARSLSLERSADPVLVDEEVGYRILALEQPLEPGESTRLAFDLAYRPRGFPSSGIRTDIVANGTSFNRKVMPIIGYQSLLELSDPEARERFDLPPQPPAPGPEDVGPNDRRWSLDDADLVEVDAVLGTAAGQIAITPGVLHRTWSEGDRSYFHYRTETPIAFGGTIFSANYSILEDRWHDVALRIYHHPTHDANLDRMLLGMKASLDCYTEQFGPYPYGDLSIVEVPRYGGFGSAHPHTIAFTEDAFLSRVREGEVDQPFYGTAHEVAHTWWGGLVRGARVRGAAFLSESLANYSAMLVTERTYGPEAGRRVYQFQMERYLRGRATQAREVPVLEVEDQPYIAYRKGALALYVLREHIGEEALHAALRRYFERYRDAAPPYPTSLDLYAELRAATPEPLHPLLTDWFETITLWDVRTERALVEPTADGQFAVTLDVVARKLRADDEGNETEVPMDDLIEIGVYAPTEAADPGEPLHLESHRIRSGKQTIRIVVPRAPARAGVDPRHELIDRQPNDHVVRVLAAEARATSDADDH